MIGVRPDRQHGAPGPVAAQGGPTAAANPLAGMMGIAKGVRERPPGPVSAGSLGTNPGPLAAKPNGSVLGNRLRGQDRDPREEAIKRMQATLR